MDPQKLAFLTALMGEAKNQSSDQLMPFLMSAAKNAGQKGITFSDEETDLFYQEMKKNLKPEDQVRIDMLYQMLRKRR